MSERMIRINNCRECQECIRAFKGDGVGVPDDCVLEHAPPKDWTPLCFGMLYNTGFTCCDECPFEKKCENAEREMDKACGIEHEEIRDAQAQEKYLSESKQESKNE